MSRGSRSPRARRSTGIGGMVCARSFFYDDFARRFYGVNLRAELTGLGVQVVEATRQVKSRIFCMRFMAVSFPKYATGNFFRRRGEYPEASPSFVTRAKLPPEVFQIPPGRQVPWDCGDCWMCEEKFPPAAEWSTVRIVSCLFLLRSDRRFLASFALVGSR